MIVPITSLLPDCINAGFKMLPSSSTYFNSPLWLEPPTVLLTMPLIMACINKVRNVTVEKFQLTGLKREGEDSSNPLSVKRRQLEGRDVSFPCQVHHPTDHRSLIMVVNIPHPSCISMISSISGLGWMASFLPQLGIHWFRMAYWDVHVIRPPNFLYVMVWLALVYHHLNHCPGTQSWQNTKNWNTIKPQYWKESAVVHSSTYAVVLMPLLVSAWIPLDSLYILEWLPGHGCHEFISSNYLVDLIFW